MHALTSKAKVKLVWKSGVHAMKSCLTLLSSVKICQWFHFDKIKKCRDAGEEQLVSLVAVGESMKLVMVYPCIFVSQITK